MKSLNEDFFNPFFSHIYVEKAVKEHGRVREILAKFPYGTVVEIDHYKDVFCRSRQNSVLQHHSRKLILAARQGTLLYPGAPVCQSFGNPYFYYTSCVMNCIFDCEYCYLKGMYPSANIVVFVNLEDIFSEAEKLLKSHPLYLSVSYDTDLLALEQLLGYVKEWCGFAQKHTKLKLEIRTKAANRAWLEKVRILPNVIYAFTLSPREVIERWEHKTPSLEERLYCAAELLRAGVPVRLCFDPMICLPEWERHYEEMLEQVCRSVDLNEVLDVSVGTFRISQDYLKKMRKQQPDSAVVWFPFQKENGYCHYPDKLVERMESFLTDRLKKRIPEEKIFRWNKPQPRSGSEKEAQIWRQPL